MKNILPFIITGFTVTLFSCKTNVDVARVADPPVISDSLAKIIKIDTVKNEYIEDQLSLSGEVNYDDNKVIKIFPNASGQVVSVNVSLGDKVKRGQTLAAINSADVAGNYADLTTVNSDAAIAEKEYKNAEQLYKNGISSEKDYMQAKLEYDKAMNAVRKVQMQISINGGGKTKAGGSYIITSPCRWIYSRKKHQLQEALYVMIIARIYLLFPICRMYGCGQMYSKLIFRK